ISLETRPMPEELALAMHDVIKHFPVRRSLFGRGGATVKAVDGVDLAIPHGQTFGLVGESGCGKTTLACLVLKLLEPTSGQIRVDGHDVGELARGDLRDFRRAVQMVFQDPHGSLDPRQTMLSAIREPLLTLRVARGRAEASERVVATLDLVG